MANDELVPAREMAAKRKPLFPAESAAYAQAREALLAEEIELRRHETRVAVQRRALPPGPVVDATWAFKDEQGFDATLTDLFGPHDTLVTYFWMYGPERDRPCPMCTTTVGSLNGNARSIRKRAALKILGRSTVARQCAFAQERGWRDIDFVQTVGDAYANDLRLLRPDGFEDPALVVYRKDGDRIRLFWAAETNGDMADPGQDPRSSPDLAILWSVLDLTPEGRGTDWYPRLGD